MFISFKYFLYILIYFIDCNCILCSPRTLLEEEEVDVGQEPIQEHGENIEDQDNDPIEEDNDVDNKFE